MPQTSNGFTCDYILRQRIEERIWIQTVMESGKRQGLTTAKVARLCNLHACDLRAFLDGTGTISEAKFTELCDLLNLCD